MMKKKSEFYTHQFDGKEHSEVVIVSYLDGDIVKRKPLEVFKYNRAPTGRDIAQQLAKLPIPPKDVFALVADTTSVNNGTGKIGGACYWYQHETNTKCFVVMCRLHSLECISGVALKKFNFDVFCFTPKFEKGTSGIVKSLLQHEDYLPAL